MVKRTPEFQGFLPGGVDPMHNAGHVLTVMHPPGSALESCFWVHGRGGWGKDSEVLAKVQQGIY